MPNHRNRAIYIGLSAILLAWLLAWSGYVIFGHSKMTAEKLSRYQRELNLARLSAADRLKALKALADKINALSPAERQRWHLDLEWFRQLTDQEKAFFMEAFLPGEMKVALQTFEKWPQEKQQQEIDKAFAELRKNAADPQHSQFRSGGTNAPIITPELDKQIRTMGLNTIYSQGSVQTRAQLAPLLLEVQRQFESGKLNLSQF